MMPAYHPPGDDGGILMSHWRDSHRGSKASTRGSTPKKPATTPAATAKPTSPKPAPAAESYSHLRGAAALEKYNELLCFFGKCGYPSEASDEAIALVEKHAPTLCKNAREERVRRDSYRASLR